MQGPGNPSAALEPAVLEAALAEMIARGFPGAYLRDLEEFLGITGVTAIATWLARLAAAQLGGIGKPLFARKSVGVVFGFELDTGTRAVLKLFSRQLSAGQLAAMQSCLSMLIARGFPAPRPLAPLFESDAGLFGAGYEFAPGIVEDAHQPWVREKLAEALARLTRDAASVDPSALCASPSAGPGLWPPPHRSTADLTRAAADAAPIDARGLAAQRTLQDCDFPHIAAHMDWGTKNAYFVGRALSAVFDWDSLCHASEAEMVGRAAAQFTAQWDREAALTPTHAEARAFVSDYEHARGRRFSPKERRVAAAAAEYLIAQVARLEHALSITPENNYLALFAATRDEPLLDV